MTTNITTLALNLLISERADQRIMLADKIAALLPELNDNSESDKAMKKVFLSAIGQCKINPNCEVRDAFFQLAQYFTEKMNANAKLSSAA